MHGIHFRKVAHLFNVGGDTKDDDGLEAIGDQGGQELYQQVDTPAKKGDFEKEKKSLEVSNKVHTRMLKNDCAVFPRIRSPVYFPSYTIFPHTLM